MRGDHLTLLYDNSLSDGARAIGMHVSVQAEAQEEEWVELGFDEFQRLLHGYPSRDSIRKHLRMLEAAGYVERKPGGRGHSDRFRWNRVGSETTLSEIKGVLRSSPKDRARRKPTLNSFRVARERPYPSRVDEEEEVGEGEEGERGRGRSEDRAGIATEPLPVEVEDVLQEQAELFSGCRGAVRDYLRQRVPGPDRQLGYVRTLQVWLDGGGAGVWKSRRSGTSLPRKQWTGALAEALNELLATDESTYRSSPGDIRNLRNKLTSGVIPSRVDGSGNGGGGSGGRKERGSGLGRNQGDFEFEDCEV